MRIFENANTIPISFWKWFPTRSLVYLLSITLNVVTHRVNAFDALPSKLKMEGNTKLTYYDQTLEEKELICYSLSFTAYYDLSGVAIITRSGENLEVCIRHASGRSQLYIKHKGGGFYYSEAQANGMFGNAANFRDPYGFYAEIHRELNDLAPEAFSDAVQAGQYMWPTGNYVEFEISNNRLLYSKTFDVATRTPTMEIIYFFGDDKTEIDQAPDQVVGTLFSINNMSKSVKWITAEVDIVRKDVYHEPFDQLTQQLTAGLTEVGQGNIAKEVFKDKTWTQQRDIVPLWISEKQKLREKINERTIQQNKRMNSFRSNALPFSLFYVLGAGSFVLALVVHFWTKKK